MIRQCLPTLSIGGVTADGLLGESRVLDELAQRRYEALADDDAAGHRENQGFVAMQVPIPPCSKRASAAGLS